MIYAKNTLNKSFDLIVQIFCADLILICVESFWLPSNSKKMIIKKKTTQVIDYTLIHSSTEI